MGTTSLWLMDPATSGEVVNTAIQQTDNFMSAFSATFSTRLLGTIVGNIVAAFVFKQVTDVGSKLLGVKSSSSAPTKESKGGWGGIFGGDDRQKQQSTRNERGIDMPSDYKRRLIGTDEWVKLVICLAIDFIGDSSFLLPGVGEVEDVAWAPLSSVALAYLFGSTQVTGLDFVKEILPFTDILPVATIAWALQNLYYDSDASKLLGLAKEAKKLNGKCKGKGKGRSAVLDVDAKVYDVMNDDD